MNFCLLLLCYSSLFVQAAKRKIGFVSVLEEPSQKIQRLNQEEAVIFQATSLFILADLVPLFLQFSDHRLAHNLSQVNHACFQAVCSHCFLETKSMPRSLDLAEQPWKIILNFAFQHLVKAKDTISRPDKLNFLSKLLIGLDNKAISMAVTEHLKAISMDKFEINSLSLLLNLAHIHRGENGVPTPYQTMYPIILIGGFEYLSEKINNEVVRMLRYRKNPGFPGYAENMQIYHKFFQDMFIMFPEFCAQKFQELLDTETVFPLGFGHTSDYTDIFREIMGPNVALVASALATEPIGIRLKVNNFAYLWKLILNKLTFLPRRIPAQIHAQFDHLDPEIFAELGRVLKLVGALKTSDALSFADLCDIKIFRLMNYISHTLQIDRTPEYVRSIAAKVVTTEDASTPFYLKTVLYHASYGHYIYEILEEKLSALTSEECLLEHLKYVGPTTILRYLKYYAAIDLPQSFVPLLQSNLRRIALGDKVMAGKYDAVLSFMAKTFPDTFEILVSFMVSMALSDKLLSEEKTLFFVFDEISGMTASLRKCYYSVREANSTQPFSYLDKNL